MTPTFDLKLFAYLSLAFIIMTAIGTVSHESGHYIAARLLGFDATINYEMTTLAKHPYRHMSHTESFLFLLGGPAQTMITGTLGCLLVWVFRKSYQEATQLSFIQWGGIFMALFWLRQAANLFTWILFYFIKGRLSRRGDEIRLAHYAHAPAWAIIVPTALLGALVLAIVFFKVIPQKSRLTFLFSGLFGGIIGYILWFYYLGNVIMP